MPCTRCGKPSQFQWNACANGNWWLPVCEDCDIALNRLALEFMNVPHVEILMEEYEKNVRGRLT